MTQPVKEQVVLLGRRKSLVGIIAQGPMHRDNEERPAIVILNSGIIHRVGPNRMSVTLARSFASVGHLVLRFDLSGIGDSEPRVDALPPLEAALADIREALDWLESARGARRVILLGLCSGADHAAIYGGSDPRVVGAVLLDPWVPTTRRYWIRYWFWRTRWYAERLSSPRVTAQLLSRLIQRRTTDDEAQIGMTASLSNREVREFLEQAYRRAIDSGLSMLAVFTAGRRDRHNYRTQILEAFPNLPFGDRLQLEYFDDADHVFTSRANRTRLLELLRGWIERTDFAGTRARSGVGDVPADRCGKAGTHIVRGPVAE
jgi:pimeloyl-ACP methyl ester carboxylesterase